MALDTTKDLLFFMLAIATLGIAGFICWCLYELAQLLRQANQVVADTREKISRVERAIATIKEKLESSVNYLGMFATGWKSFLGLFEKREERREQRRKAKKPVEETDEDEI